MPNHCVGRICIWKTSRKLMKTTVLKFVMFIMRRVLLVVRNLLASFLKSTSTVACIIRESYDPLPWRWVRTTTAVVSLTGIFKRFSYKTYSFAGLLLRFFYNINWSSLRSTVKHSLRKNSETPNFDPTSLQMCGTHHRFSNQLSIKRVSMLRSCKQFSQKRGYKANTKRVMPQYFKWGLWTNTDTTSSTI